MDPYEAINRPAAHCPSCGAEYRAGFDTCADCGVPLEPGPSPLETDDAVRPSADTSPPAADAWREATDRAWGPRGPDGEDHLAPVVVARLPLQEAMLLVGRLEEAGIPACVESDVSPYFVEALNVLKSVLVPRSRLDEARRVVEEIESGLDRI